MKFKRPPWSLKIIFRIHIGSELVCNKYKYLMCKLKGCTCVGGSVTGE